ncbi:MAG: peptidoglycan DD-metalloendopeptidase family protein [Acutalibacteraceae bacterium]|nr:peptidoglycan DD-metalloendopeptidase family protein [Acutalibacteraceae bacterium]
MGKGIKTREVVKEIKVHDTAVNVGDRIKDIGIKTKEKVNENTTQPDSVSPEQYATDKVTEGMRTGAETTVTGTKKVAQKGVDKIKQKRADTKAKKAFEEELKQVKAEDVSEFSPAPNDEKPKPDNPKEKSTSKKSPKQNTNKPIKEKSQAAPKSTEQETSPKAPKQKQGKSVKEKPSTPEIKEKVQSTPKVRQTEKAEVIDEVKKPRQRKQTPPKTKSSATVKKANADNKSIRTIGADAHKVKQSKRSIDNSRKSIKTANNGVKSAKKTAKTTKTTAKQSAEIAQRTKQAAKVAVKTTAKTVKAVGKAIVAGTKATVAAVKELAAAIYAGGPVVIIIIVVICLIAAIGGTCFGIFLSNDETTGTDKTMSQAISELTSEHYANLTAMKASYSYDLFEVQGNSSINWKDVLAIYAVKTTTSTEEAMEVVTLDEKKLELLREIVNDMNTMTGIVTPKLVAETTVTTDAEGNPVKTTTYVTKKVLTVVIAQLNANQTAEIYKFDDEQKSQLAELMSEEYDPLWIELIGANGDIIIGEGSWQGTDMFTWPLAVDGTITSRFGTRKDPISGEIKTHGGTDIATATGTSILAAADGTVISATWHNSYGYYVKIKHNDTYSTLYAHCSALLVSEGQQVKQGQVIAQVGSTGYSTGPHLHFEVIQNGVRVDALLFYKSK